MAKSLVSCFFDSRCSLPDALTLTTGAKLFRRFTGSRDLLQPRRRRLFTLKSESTSICVRLAIAFSESAHRVSKSNDIFKRI